MGAIVDALSRNEADRKDAESIEKDEHVVDDEDIDQGVVGAANAKDNREEEGIGTVVWRPEMVAIHTLEVMGIHMVVVET